MGWLVWILPVGLFWPIAALYLGSMREVKGGTLARQLIGLLVSFAVFLLLWWVLRRVLTPVRPVLGGIIIPTAASLLAMPLVTALGFRLLGVKVVREAPAH